MANYPDIVIEDYTVEDFEDFLKTGASKVKNINVWQATPGIYNVVGTAFLTENSLNTDETDTENKYINTGEGFILIVSDVIIPDFSGVEYVVLYNGLTIQSLVPTIKPKIVFGYTDGNTVTESEAENSKLKVDTVSGNETSDKKYPTVKAVVDAIKNATQNIEITENKVIYEDATNDNQYPTALSVKRGFENINQNFSNALKSSVTGTNILRISDLSPILHQIKVNLSQSNVNVDVYGKNLFQVSSETFEGVSVRKIDDYYVLNGTAEGSYNFGINIGYLPGGKYTLSANNQSNSNINTTLIDVYSPETNTVLAINDNSDYGVKTGDLSTGNNYRTRIRVEKGVTYDNFILKPQLEYSSKATDYEEFKKPISYVADENGDIENLISIYPNITLIATQEDVVINAKYNNDINKVIGDIESALDGIISIQNKLIGGDSI